MYNVEAGSSLMSSSFLAGTYIRYARTADVFLDASIIAGIDRRSVSLRLYKNTLILYQSVIVPDCMMKILVRISIHQLSM